MISLRARILTFIFLILLILGVIGGFLFLRSKQQASQPADEFKEVAPEDLQVAPSSALTPSEQTGIQVKQTTTEEAEKKGVQQLARIFIERYGSYSTDNSFQNIRDVQSLATKRLWSELSPMIKKNGTAPSFSSKTTNVYSFNLLSFQTGSASVELKAKVIEEKAGVQNSSYTSAKVALVKEGDDWLVDSFTWEK